MMHLDRTVSGLLTGTVMAIAAAGILTLPGGAAAVMTCSGQTPPATLTDDYQTFGGYNCFTLSAGQDLNMNGKKISCYPGHICGKAIVGNGGNSDVSNGTIEGNFYTGGVSNVRTVENLNIRSGVTNPLINVKRAQGNVISGFYGTAIQATFSLGTDYVSENYITGGSEGAQYGIRVNSTAATGSPDLERNFVLAVSDTGVVAEGGRMDVKGNIVGQLLYVSEPPIPFAISGIVGAAFENFCFDCDIPTAPFVFPDGR